MIGGQPIFILKEGTKRETGKDAMKNNIDAAKSIANAVRSSLGPRGMDKMLVDSLGDIVITNDGVTILKEMDVEHPAAKMMVEVSKTQDTFVGDGTTTAVIVAGALLQEAESLINQNVHPTVISAGYRMAADQAKKILDDVKKPVKFTDKELLMKMAATSLSSKSASSSKEKLSEISYESIRAVAEKTENGYSVDFDNIQIVKKQGGDIDDTQLIYGIIVDKEKVHPGMPDFVKGFVMCGYLNLDAANKLGDCAVRVSGVSDLRTLLDSKAAGVSEEAKKLGISEGQKVSEFVQLLA